MDEQIHGLSMRDCAELMGKQSELRAQLGEREADPEFARHLASRGIDQNTFAHAWNGWWTRMEADPSGQLHAKFAMLQQQITLAAHTADIPDASQTAYDGVTLEKYAEISARAAGGEDMQAVVAEAGFDWAQWTRGSNAWNAAMGADVNHHLTTQYGQLYAKYSAGFAQRMQGQTAAIMAAHHAERAMGLPDEPEEEYTFEHMLRDMESATPNTRWSAAHLVANSWDIGQRGDPRLDQAARKAATLAQECLDGFDDFTVSNAAALAADVKMFVGEGFITGADAEDLQGDIGRALNRGKDRLAVHEAAFAPIRDKAVPERVKMQSAIQDYTSLIEELTEVLEDWEEGEADSDDSGSFGASAGGGAMTQAPKEAGGLIDTLKGIPVIGHLLRLLGL